MAEERDRRDPEERAADATEEPRARRGGEDVTVDDQPTARDADEPLDE